ncbi:MAG: response regulator [Planctomycetes bacterium]|nr:response regulator [Planctomycetota bacterium]
MNIKIHTSLVLAACTVAGLTMGGLLVERYRQIDAGIIATGPNSASMRTAQYLTEEVGEWLLVNDTVLLEGQSSMLNSSGRKAGRLRQRLDELAAAELAAGLDDRIAALQDGITSIEAKVFESREHIGDDRLEHLERIAAESRPLTTRIVEQITGLQQILRERADHRLAALEEQQDSLVMLVWLVASLYFGIVWLCWLWIVHRVVVPIERLSQAAGHADHEEGRFELPQAGPEEVRELTGNISSFVQKLQEAKAGTEEEVRQRTAELVEANKAKAQFLATMSHELRTPLNGIINMNELILETPLSAEQAGFAKTGKSAAEALLALINDILDFSKIEARKLDLEQVEFDVRELLDSAVEILGGVAESKQLELCAVIDADVPGRLLGDPTRLRQVVINLLNNALKFTSQGSVSVHAAVVAPAGGEVQLRVEVRDTGIGIPEDRRTALFQAFEQVDSSTTRKFGGTGLGLAICRELVTLMGGEIDVDSTVGEGSTFWFTVQLAVAPNAADAPNPPTNAGVAVLSRRPLQRERVVAQLRYLGLPAAAVRCGEDAEDLEAGDDKWLALVDPYGRDGDGFAPVRDLRARDDVADIAVLDHWMRHWPDTLGTAPDGVRRLKDPTSLEGLRQWLAGEAPDEAAAPPTPPAPEAHEPAPAAADEPPAAEHRTNVLVVEDTTVNQRVVRAILERAGYTATLANNGLEAVQACERQRFDLILMDCQMPVMDGLEATRCIRALELERTASSALPDHVPIVALTANAQEGFDQLCFEAGMDRFMAKPCRPGPLIAMIEEFLGPRAAAAPETPSKRRLLVADDDAINRKVAHSVLSRAGYETVLVEDGQQAVEQLQQAAFDLVLMDCQMPVMDGLAASTRIRELELASGLAKGNPGHLPIVALTGNVQEEDRDAAREAGMDEIVTKPFRPGQLVDVVERLCGPADRT